jgi:hypothetical protein
MNGTDGDQQYAAAEMGKKGNNVNGQDVQLISTDQELVFSNGHKADEPEEDLGKALVGKKTSNKPGAELLTIEGQDEAVPSAAFNGKMEGKIFNQQKTGAGRPSAVA